MPFRGDVLKTSGLFECSQCGRPVQEGDALWTWETLDGDVGVPLCGRCTTTLLIEELSSLLEDAEEEEGWDDLDRHFVLGGFAWMFEEWENCNRAFLGSPVASPELDDLLNKARGIISESK